MVCLYMTAHVKKEKVFKQVAQHSQEPVPHSKLALNYASDSLPGPAHGAEPDLAPAFVFRVRKRDPTVFHGEPHMRM